MARSMDLGLKERSALITGASAGIGRATACSLAGEGARVAMVARGAAGLETAAASIEEATGLRSLTFPADLSDPGSCDTVIASAAAELGGLDILVNSVTAPIWGSFLSHSDEDWEQAMRLKFLTYVRTSRASLPLLSRSGHGVIINVIGIGGRMAIKDHLAGGAANAALMLLTTGMAKEFADLKVRVVGVSPGAVRTERFSTMTQRMNENEPESGAGFEDDLIGSMPTVTIVLPEDVAALVTFLASDRARQINGTTITQDGGLMPAV